MEMTLSDGNVLTLTPAEFYDMLREGEAQEAKKAAEQSKGVRNVLASPTEEKADTVEHQKPKAGDLIEITGDGQVGRLAPHNYPVGTVLIVRGMSTPPDRVYAGKVPMTVGGMMIHQSFYKVVTRNVIEPCPDLPHVYGVGDIVRVTKDHDMSSRNKAGDIGVIDEISDRGSLHVYVAARDDVTEGRNCNMGYYQKVSAIELVVAKKDRKDSAVQK